MERMASYYLSLLGGFELKDTGDASITLTSTKARAILAVLANNQNETVSRTQLANLLWGDRGEDQAQGSLRQTLSQLRKCLNSQSRTPLIFSAGGVCLDKQYCPSDLDQFVQLSKSDDTLDLAKAVELYRGPLLDGLLINAPGFENWLRDERSRLNDCALDAMASLGKLYEETGRIDQALDVAERMIRFDPLRENVYRKVMNLHLLSGQSSKAVQTFLKCKSILAEELGLAPDRKTQAIYEVVLAEREGRTLPSVPIEPPDRGNPVNSVTRLRQTDQPSIAIMPFEDLGANSGDKYFSEGLIEDVITELSRSADIVVIARSSTFSFPDKNISAQDVHKELGVDYVVKGSVRMADNRVRVTAQLIEGESGKHIWAERYSRELEDVFALQDELAQGIVAVLPGRIESFQTHKALRKLPGSMVAYELLLSGKYHHHRIQKDDCILALEFLDRAIALDSGYAAAHAWKACVLGQAIGRGFMPDPAELLRQATESVNIALQLDENEIEAHRILAEISIDNRQLDRANYHNERALALYPNDPRLLAQKGELATWCGDPREGAEWIRKATHLDPFSSTTWAHLLGRALMMSGEFEEAADCFQRNAFPRFGYYAEAAGCYGMLGLVDLAKTQTELALRMNPLFTIAGYSNGLPFENKSQIDHHMSILSAAPLPV